MKRFSFVIVNYKTAGECAKLIKSLVDGETGFDKKKDEIIIVDNNSGDDVDSVVKKNDKIVELIKLESNNGYANALNLGIERSSGEYLMILNSDIVFGPENVNDFIREIEGDGGASVFVPKLILPDGSVQRSCMHLPTITGAMKRYFLGKDTYGMYTPNGGGRTKVQAAVMACFVISRKTYERVGKIWEEAFMYYEDVEYCRRIGKLGINIYYLPYLEVRHEHGKSTTATGRASLMLEHAAKKYHGHLYYLLLTLVLRIGQRYEKIRLKLKTDDAESKKG